MPTPVSIVPKFRNGQKVTMDGDDRTWIIKARHIFEPQSGAGQVTYDLTEDQPDRLAFGDYEDEVYEQQLTAAQ